MTAEEFQEAEVVWPDRLAVAVADPRWFSRRCKPSTTRGKETKPIEIPRKVGVGGRWSPNFTGEDCDDEEEEGISSDDEGTPPHILVARRVREKMASSVCTGNGRTLKGRDLSRVRNSVLRMTGYLER